jgi:hypothetical protein
MGTPSIERELGAHDAEIAHLNKKVDQIDKQMSEVLAILHEAKGGWRMLIAVGGIAGTVGASLMALVVKLFGVFR